MTTRPRTQHRLILERDERHLLARTWAKTPYHETRSITAAVTRREYNDGSVRTEAVYLFALNPHPDDDARPGDHDYCGEQQPHSRTSPLYLPLPNTAHPWPE